MHELSIATALVEQIEAIAGQHQLQRVTDVELETGALRQIIPDIMQLSFREAARGTLSEGARLDIVEVVARARCRGCSRSFEPAPNDFLCPGCDGADVAVEQGDAIILKSIACKTQQLH